MADDDRQFLEVAAVRAKLKDLRQRFAGLRSELEELEPDVENNPGAPVKISQDRGDAGTQPNQIRRSVELETRTVPSLNCLADLDDVPQVVHLSWKNKDLLASRSPVVLNGVKNIVAMNPGWRVIISDDHDVEMYLKEQLSNDDYNLIKRRHIVEKVDLWRLLKMYHEGGFYTDIDRYYNVPLSSLLGPRTKCLLPMHYDIDFAQDVMLSAPNNPIHRIAINLNLARRRQGCTDILSLGPITYFHAVTTVLCGRAIDRYPSPDIVQDLRDKIHGSEYIETYREDPPHNTMTFHYDATTWQSGTGDSLDEFYDNEGVTHWTGDCPDLPDNKPFGP